jgi:serralysin
MGATGWWAARGPMPLSYDGPICVARRIDANVHQAGNDAFAFVGAAEFTGAGQLRFHAGVLQGDVDGDGVADLVLRLLRVQDLAGMDITL